MDPSSMIFDKLGMAVDILLSAGQDTNLWITFKDMILSLIDHSWSGFTWWCSEWSQGIDRSTYLQLLCETSPAFHNRHRRLAAFHLSTPPRRGKKPPSARHFSREALDDPLRNHNYGQPWQFCTHRENIREQFRHRSLNSEQHPGVHVLSNDAPPTKSLPHPRNRFHGCT